MTGLFKRRTFSSLLRSFPAAAHRTPSLFPIFRGLRSPINNPVSAPVRKFVTRATERRPRWNERRGEEEFERGEVKERKEGKMQLSLSSPCLSRVLHETSAFLVIIIVTAVHEIYFIIGRTTGCAAATLCRAINRTVRANEQEQRARASSYALFRRERSTRF